MQGLAAQYLCGVRGMLPVGAWHACGWAHATAALSRKAVARRSRENAARARSLAAHGTCVWVRGMRVGGRMPQRRYLGKQSHVVREKTRARGLAGTVPYWVRGMRVGGRMHSGYLWEKAVARRSRGKRPCQNLAGTVLMNGVRGMRVGGRMPGNSLQEKRSTSFAKTPVPEFIAGTCVECVACVGACHSGTSAGESSRTSFARENARAGAWHGTCVGAWHACGWAHHGGASLQGESSRVVRGKRPCQEPGWHGTAMWVRGMRVGGGTCSSTSLPEKAVTRRSREENADARSLAGTVPEVHWHCAWVGIPGDICRRKPVTIVS
jgi:ferredoxin